MFTSCGVRVSASSLFISPSASDAITQAPAGPRVHGDKIQRERNCVGSRVLCPSSSGKKTQKPLLPFRKTLSKACCVAMSGMPADEVLLSWSHLPHHTVSFWRATQLLSTCPFLQCSCYSSRPSFLLQCHHMCNTIIKKIIEVSLIYSVVFNFCRTADSLLYVHILFHVLFLCGLSQDIEDSSLCCAGGRCCSSLVLSFLLVSAAERTPPEPCPRHCLYLHPNILTQLLVSFSTCALMTPNPYRFPSQTSFLRLELLCPLAHETTLTSNICKIINGLV